MDIKENDKQEAEATYLRSVYDSVFNFTQDAIALLDTEMNIVKSNIPFMKIASNYSSSSDIVNIFELIRNDGDRKCFLSVIEDNILMMEITLYSLNGMEPCILQAKLGPIKDNGKVIGAFAIFVDITDFRKREEELNRRFKMICRLVENANLGIVIIDQDHKVLEANQRFCEMTGYSQNEITDLHTWDWEYVADENAIRDIFSDLSEIHSTFDTIHKRKDGTTYHVTVSASGFDVFGDGNDVVMCICQDISAKKEMAAKLRLSEKKFRTYIENAADMILTVGNDGRIKYVSPNCEKICGLKTPELVEKQASDIFIDMYAEDEKPSNVFSTDPSEANGSYRTFRMEHKDGTIHWYGMTISMTSDEDGKPLLICNARNIDNSIEKEKKLQQLSLYDHLTGAANKAFFDAMLKRVQNNGLRPISILVCDMDYLKSINDKFGHAKGDEALKIAADMIKSSLRKDDFIARIGGDEFAVILPGAGKEQAMGVVERLQKSISEHNSHSKNLSITISVGLSTIYDTDASLEDALYKADMDMYRRKHQRDH